MFSVELECHSSVGRRASLVTSSLLASLAIQGVHKTAASFVAPIFLYQRVLDRRRPGVARATDDG
jgi:hypothetical protein